MVPAPVPEPGDGHAPARARAPGERTLELAVTTVRERPSGLTRLAVRNGSVAFAARISGILSGILLTPFVLDRLGRELYGVVTATSSTFDYLTLLRGGLGEATRRHVTLHAHSSEPQRARAYYAAGFWWGLLLRLMLLGVGCALAGPLATMLHVSPQERPDAVFGIRLVFLAAVLHDTSAVFEVPIYATGRLAAISITRAALTWVRVLCVFAGLTLLAPSLRSYAGALVASASVGLLVFLFLGMRTRIAGPILPRPELGNAALRREIFSYGGLFLVVQLSSLLYLAADNLMIGAIYGPAAVTAYSLGARWSPLVRGFIGSLVGPTAPLFTQLEAHGQEARTRAAILRAVALTSSLAVPACLVPCLLGDLFLTHWVGEEYRSSASYMRVMLGAATLDAAFSPVWIAMMGRGRVGWIAGGDLGVAIGNVVFSLILGVGFGLGLLGFAIGNAAAIVMKNLVLRPLVARREPAVPDASQFAPLLLRALAGGLPGLVLLYFARPLCGANLATVIAGGAVGGALVLLGSGWAAMGPGALRELLDRAGVTRTRHAQG